MVTETITVQLSGGLHARNTAAFVHASMSYPCKVMLCKNESWADGKNMMDLMNLFVVEEDQLLLMTEGTDEHVANNTLSHFLTAGAYTS